MPTQQICVNGSMGLTAASKVPLTARTVVVGLGTIEEANKILMKIMSGSGLVKKVSYRRIPYT